MVFAFCLGFCLPPSVSPSPLAESHSIQIPLRPGPIHPGTTPSGPIPFIPLHPSQLRPGPFRPGPLRPSPLCLVLLTPSRPTPSSAAQCGPISSTPWLHRDMFGCTGVAFGCTWAVLGCTGAVFGCAGAAGITPPLEALRIGYLFDFIPRI